MLASSSIEPGGDGRDGQPTRTTSLVRVVAQGWGAALLAAAAAVASEVVAGALAADGVIPLIGLGMFVSLIPASVLVAVGGLPIAWLLARLPAPRAGSWALRVGALLLPLAVFGAGIVTTPLWSAKRMPWIWAWGLGTLLALLAAAAAVVLLRLPRRLVGTGAFCVTLIAITASGPYLQGYRLLLSLAPVVVGWIAWQPTAPSTRWLWLGAALGAASLGGVAFGGDGAVVGHANQRLTQAGGMLQWSAMLVDFDRDGATPLLGDGECDDFDPAVGRGQVEIANNGVDDNCIGGDLETADPALESPLLPREVKLARRHSVIAITVDTLRADFVGRHRAGVRLTPNIDALRRESVAFSRAYAPSTHTSSSLTAIWTSSPVFSMHRGAKAIGFEASLADLLAIAGYQTVAVLSLPSDWWHPTLGFNVVEVVGTDRPRAAPSQQCSSATVTKRALAAARRLVRQRQPFFLWVHYLDPHAPFALHEQVAQLGASLAGRYAQEVWYADRHLGGLVAGLKQLGLWDTTVLLFFADHGEALAEQGRLVHHAWTVAEEVIRVPLAIRAPGIRPGTVSTPISLVDLAPTVIDLLGGTPAPRWVGRSLKAALQGERPAPRPLFVQANYLGLRGELCATIDWPWKYVEEPPARVPLLRYLGRGRPPPAPPLERLRQLTGAYLDRATSDGLMRRRARHLRQPRPGCSWALHVGMRREANQSLEQGYDTSGVRSCAPRGWSRPAASRQRGPSRVVP